MFQCLYISIFQLAQCFGVRILVLSSRLCLVHDLLVYLPSFVQDQHPQVISTPAQHLELFTVLLYLFTMQGPILIYRGCIKRKYLICILIPIPPINQERKFVVLVTKCFYFYFYFLDSLASELYGLKLSSLSFL